MPHTPAPRPADEAKRQAALDRLELLDTLPEQAHDDIVLLASQICGTPISAVSLIDNERQWFKAQIGLSDGDGPRDDSFCGHAIMTPTEIFTVRDALEDVRFVENPAVQGEPHVRFYAGAPIVTHDGAAIGTVCVVDTVPRELTARQEFALRALARQAAALFQMRQRVFSAERAMRQGAEAATA